MGFKLHPTTHPSELWPLNGDLEQQFVAGTSFGDLRKKELSQQSNLSILENAWINCIDAQDLLSSGNDATLVDDRGNRIAWTGNGEGVILRAAESYLIRYAWDLIRVNETVVARLTENSIEGELSPAANVEGNITVGKGTRILPGVFIEGNVIIGENCKIGPNCYLRGHTAIGDNCHIGQAVEIKNSIIGHKSAVGHLSYLGDSILDHGVNFGAGTITSNLRHDGKNHQSAIGSTLVDTGRRKFGAIIGANVHTGIHTSIYPGRKIGQGQTTLPGGIVSKDL